MWNFNTQSQDWTLLSGNPSRLNQSASRSNSIIAGSRYGHVMVLDAAGDRLIIHGGYGFGQSNNVGLLGDCWFFAIGSKVWSYRMYSSYTNENVFVDKPMYFNGWNIVIGSRAFHTATFDPWTSYMFVFGGVGVGGINEI